MTRKLLLLLGFLSMASVAGAELRHAGNVVSTTVTGVRADLTLQNGAVARVEAVTENTLRVRFAPSGQLSTFISEAVVTPAGPARNVALYDTPDAVYFVSAGFIAGVYKTPYRVIVWRPTGELLQADLEPAVSWETTGGVIYTRKWAPQDERYYGFGERGGPLNRRGRTFAMQNKDLAAFGALSDPLYISIPYFWGARGSQVYGIFVDNPAVPFFDADSEQNGTLLFGALAGDLDYYLFAGPTPDQVAKEYGHVTGYSALPPKWSLGYHQSRYGYRSQTEVLTIASTLRALQIPADVLYFDIDYLDSLQMFSWNLQAFPDPQWMNQLLGQLGFRRVNIMEPLVHTGDRFWLPLASAGYFLKSPTGDPLIKDIWFGAVSFLDFTKSAAADWYRQTLAAFMTTGIDAVWNDLNEPAANDMPDAVYDFDGQPRFDYAARNLYALKHAKVSYLAQRDLRPNVRPWGISRAGFSGIQRYLANWGGDALSDWETLRTNLQMSLSMGLSGQNFFGHDIGGFLGAPDAELFMRWMEFSAYTPLFRNHAMNTSPAREPWAFGEPTLTRSRNVINERYRLLPYFYTLFEEASRTGAPTLAPAFYHFPADEALWNDDSMFMVGSSMLVAPVLWQGAVSRPVYLPAGSDWYDASSDAVHQGGSYYDVAAPLGQPPVFVRAPAVIPKGPVMQHTGEAPLVEPHLHLYRAAGTFNTSFTMYEDDGQSFNFTAGDFLRTRATFSGTATSERAVIERAAGTYAAAAGRSWTLELHGVATATSVLRNGIALTQFATLAELETAGTGWTISGGRVVVRVPDSANPIVVETAHDAL